MIDLKPFCGTDETRPYLLKPFSFEDRTYATDGRIMVRVPRMADVPEITKHADWKAPMEGIETVALSPLEFNLPPKPPHGEECDECDGSGKAHECPDCECECEECDGTGHEQPEKKTSTTVRGVTFGLRYVRLMLSLPGVQVMDKPAAGKPLLFKFDGGDGAVMPTLGEMAEHIKIEKAA